MKAIAKIIIEDEVNVRLEQVAQEDINHLINLTKIFIPTAVHDAMYKLKKWDGKKSHVNKDGTTYYFMLKYVLPVLQQLGYTFSLIDNRKPRLKLPESVSEDIYIDDDVVLRYYQKDAVNASLEAHGGIIDMATNAGKTIYTATMCRIMKDSGYTAVVIVPSEQLCNQTHDTIVKLVPEAKKLHGKITGKKRKEAFSSDFLVCTWQTLKNYPELGEKFDAFLYDEGHNFGDKMFEYLTKHMRHAQIRIMMTGTVPDEKWKRETLNCVVNNDVIYTKTSKELIDENFSSSLEINMIGLRHNIRLPIDPFTERLEWGDEEYYLGNNQKRIKAIIDLIAAVTNNLDGNILIMAFPELGNKLAKELNTVFIDKDVKVKEREKIFNSLSDKTGQIVTASYGTSSTGISQDNIQYMFCIDLGKNKTRIIQTIGRGLRKDGEKNHLVVYDVYSKLYQIDEKGRTVFYNHGANRHLQLRKGIYRKNGYVFKEVTDYEVK